MKIFLATLVNRFINFGCKLFGKNGTQLPGYWVLKIFGDDIVSDVKYPKYVIAVTGSSGKGTTCNLIKHILTDAGLSVALNEYGSNGEIGTTTLIFNNLKLNGEFKKDVLLLECDERHLQYIFPKKKPTHLIITNLTRDQPVRNGTPEIIFKEINKALDDSIHLIINSDDPLVSRLKLTHKGKITTYGIDKTKHSFKNPALNNVDFAYCPKCHEKLEYSYYHYGHLGDYKCPRCDFYRGTPDYLATNINLEKQHITIDGNEIYINKNALYTAYATTAAYTLAKVLNIREDKILYALNNDKIASKRGKTYYIAGRPIMMLETKNENNLSYYQSCEYIREQKGTKTVILGFENVSRRYKENDLSWLYDVNFELLNDEAIDKIFCIGRFRYDVKTRLEYAGIDKNKLVLVDDLNNLLKLVETRSKGDIYTMVCFDMTAIIKEMIEKSEKKEQEQND